MKTLIYTSIYSKLYGTEFGGRPSRGYHYKSSFLNVLNLNADKFICFVPQEELSELETYFYTQRNVSKDKLEFIVFNLEESKYFNEIRNLKNLEEIKKMDRCFEIQYNKFFWFDLLPNKESYEKIYWFDAGLSHSGLFPPQYSFGNGQDKYYSFTVFNREYLDKLNNITESKPILIGKNNQHSFFWSQTIPATYYKEYNRDYHVIGGFFGGKIQDMVDLKNDFEELLVKLLHNEDKLYMEEQILCCLYFNNPDKFELLKFDDWYKRDTHKDGEVKYFYNLFVDNE